MTDANISIGWLSFIAEMTKALAWPVSIMVAVITLRARISDAIDRIRSIKHGDTELSFGIELNEARHLAESAGVTLVRPSSSFSRPLLQLASQSPTAAIIEGWKLLETSLKGLAKRSDISWRSPAQVVSALAKSGRVDASLVEILRQLILLRNKAVHGLSTDISEGEAIEFIMLSRSITERVNQVGSG